MNSESNSRNHNDQSRRSDHPSQNGERIRDTRGDIRQYNQGYSRRRSPMPPRDAPYNGSYGESSRDNYRSSEYDRYGDSYRNSSRGRYDQRDNGRGRGFNERDGYRGRANRNDDGRGYRNEDSRGQSPSRNRRHGHQELPQNLSEEALFERYEKKLIHLLEFPTLKTFPLKSSRWGEKPKAFENVTAQRAKLSGYFQLPTAQSSGETKLEDLMKSGNIPDDVLKAHLKIDPIDSRASRIVLVKDVDLQKVSPLKLAQYINKFLRLAELPGISLDDNIKRTEISRAHGTVICEFKSPSAATLCLCLNGKTVLGRDLEVEDRNDDFDMILNLARPQEYVVQCLPPKDRQSKELVFDVVDSPCKLSLLIDKETTETNLQDALNEIAPLRAFKLLREIGTKEALGIAFVEFYMNNEKFPDVVATVKGTREYVEKINELPMVEKAFFLCLEFSEGGKLLTSVQDCFIELNTLKGLVRNKFVQFHAKEKVIELVNILTAADYASKETMNFVKEDVKEEASKFGKVVSMHIPQPDLPIIPGTSIERQPGIGKIFIEYEDESTALKALMGMAGRCYNDRTIICAFFNHQDYLKGIF
ncbi:hypothetical protein PUMCH_004334 [Australozyma saopauloensis]|uniref:RRM domain-containing protein n=1 Tax=Australozyma saopauloensis TaxID=291208 RepID=A0AAX4HEB6_9ASCO|nr:hypothetical protein PUMCH_004334 [[Candida] saopauloensis]